MSQTKQGQVGREEKVYTTEELFGADRKRICIRHGEKIYRLMITSQGKLILNKE